MPDITMCVGTGCPLRENCYRYMAEPNGWRQSFADFTGLVKDGKCAEQIPLSGKGGQQ